jgi:hypothetical protein
VERHGGATNLYHQATALLGQQTSLASILSLPRYLRREGTRTGKLKMDEPAEAFMDAWLDANVTHKHAKRASSRTIKALANRCMQDATAAGISLNSLEVVVVDIEEAITDELNFIATMETKKGGS